MKIWLMLLFILSSVSYLFAQTTDNDGDGVPNDKDLCPNTPIGTIVNTYGCPTTIANCDYSSSTVTFNSGIVPVGKETRYVLANAVDGKIVQISTTPTFTGLTGSKTYMVLAYTYTNDGTLVNLTINNYLNRVAAVCADWSNALVVKVCVPTDGGNDCDFTTSTITLKTTTPVQSGVTTNYVLTSPSGIILQVVNTPTFTGLSETNIYNVYAISYKGGISNLNIGKKISDVSSTCFDWSLPVSVKVCVCKPNICIPITITKIKYK